MGHRAAVYSVRIRPLQKPKDLKYFGDFDGQGSYLADRFVEYLEDQGFQSVNADGSKLVRCERCSLNAEELQVALTHGQSGVDADITDPAGVQVLHHQDPDQIHRVRCLSLLRLPRAQTIGWLAVHVNNGRSAKQLLTQELTDRLRAQSDLVLEVTPFVEESALWAAVEQDRIERVTLVRTERPDDRAVGATDKWVSRGDAARIELHISIPERAKHMIGNLIKGYHRNEDGAFERIIEFENLTFDEAKVAVELENGTTRTFNIEKPEAGHAFTTDMDELDYEDGVPTDESVFAALADALTAVAD